MPFVIVRHDCLHCSHVAGSADEVVPCPPVAACCTCLAGARRLEPTRSARPAPSSPCCSPVPFAYVSYCRCRCVVAVLSIIPVFPPPCPRPPRAPHATDACGQPRGCGRVAPPVCHRYALNKCFSPPHFVPLLFSPQQTLKLLPTHHPSPPHMISLLPRLHL